MKSRKLIIILLALFLTELLPGNFMNPWRFGFLFPERPGLGVGMILLNFAGAALFAILVAAIFLAYEGEPVKQVVQTSTLKGLILALAIYLIFKLLWDQVILSKAIAAWNLNNVQGPVLSRLVLFVYQLASQLPRLLFLWLTVRFLLRFMSKPFSFHFGAFWTAVAVSVLLCLPYACLQYLPIESARNGNVSFQMDGRLIVYGFSFTQEQWIWLSYAAHAFIAACMDWAFFAFFRKSSRGTLGEAATIN